MSSHKGLLGTKITAECLLASDEQFDFIGPTIGRVLAPLAAAARDHQHENPFRGRQTAVGGQPSRLPNGQILMTDFSNIAEVYTPN